MLNEDEERQAVSDYLKEHYDTARSIKDIAHNVGRDYTTVWAAINYLYSRGLVGKVEINRRDNRFFYISSAKKKLK